MDKKKIAFRWIAASVFWFALIGCFFFSWYSMRLVADVTSYAKGRAITPEMVAEERVARETARGFVVDWGTFSVKNPNDYQTRIGAWLNKTIPVPQGEQKTTSAAVIGIDRIEQGLWRTSLVIQGERWSQSKEAFATDAPVFAWNPFIQRVEVTVRVDKGKGEIVGLPVIVPLDPGGWVEPEKLIEKESPSEDFVGFAKQALDLYFRGDDLSNFTLPNTNIRSLGEWEMKDCKITAYEPTGRGARAVIQTVVTTPGIDNLRQTIIVEAEKKDRWLLSRLGGI